MGTGIIIAGVAGLVALVVLGIGVRGIRGERQKNIEERLGRYTSEYGSLIADFEEESQPDPIQQQSAITRRLDSALAWPHGQLTSTNIEHLKISPKLLLQFQTPISRLLIKLN